MRRVVIVAFAILATLVAIVALYFELSIRHWVEFDGRRNSLTCTVQTADGIPLDDVELIFSAGDGFRLIPLSGMGGGQPDRTISMTYELKTRAPGEVTLEWPRLFLSLREVRCAGSPVPLDWRKGSLVAHWDNHQPHFLPDGSRDWDSYIPGRYKASVIIDRGLNRVTVQIGEKSPHDPMKAEPGATDNPDDAQRLREDH